MFLICFHLISRYLFISLMNHNLFHSHSVMLCENCIRQRFFFTEFKLRLYKHRAHPIIVFCWMIVTSNLKSLKVMHQANGLYNLLDSSNLMSILKNNMLYHGQQSRTFMYKLVVIVQKTTQLQILAQLSPNKKSKNSS